MSDLEFCQIKKYAKAVSKFELGIWHCADITLLKGMSLTTWSDAVQTKGKNKGKTKNTWEVMRQDNFELKRRLRKEYGIEFESCMCGELSPGRLLVHLHGLWRLSEFLSSAELHGVVSELWGKIHDSPVVWVQDVYNENGARVYSMKHALKEYLDSGYGMRMLISRGWMPLNWREATKVFVRWYLDHRYPSWAEDGVSPEWLENEEENEGFKKYVPLAREMIKDFQRRWAYGESVVLDWSNGVTVLNREKIYERKEFEQIS